MPIHVGPVRRVPGSIAERPPLPVSGTRRPVRYGPVVTGGLTIPDNGASKRQPVDSSSFMLFRPRRTNATAVPTPAAVGRTQLSAGISPPTT